MAQSATCFAWENSTTDAFRKYDQMPRLRNLKNNLHSLKTAGSKSVFNSWLDL